MAVKDLRTVKQLAAESPAFTEASLRWIIFNAKTNGFARCIRKVGGRVLIDIAELERWVADQQPAPPCS